MKAFGDRLKEAREERGVSLDAIAEETRIGRRFLDALERSDLESLPGGPFDKGYIRSYAEFLDIDPQPFLEAYNAVARARVTPESEEQMLAELSRLADQNSARKARSQLGPRLVLALISLGLIAGVGWYLLRGMAATKDVSPQSSASETSAPPTAPPRVAIARPIDSPEPAAGSSDRHQEIDSPPAPDLPSTEQATEIASSPASTPDLPSAEEQELDEPRSTDDATDSRLTISGSGVGTAVVERRLVGKNDRFQEGTTVWFWTRVIGGESGEVLRHYWFYEGRTVRLSELAIGGHHWRTHSNYTIPPGSTGNYAVEARGPDGRVLARQEFFCFPTQNTQLQR